MTEDETTREARHTLDGNRWVAGLLVVALLLLLVALATAARTFRNVNADTEIIEHTLEMQTLINRVGILNDRIENARRGFIIQPTSQGRGVMQDGQISFDRELSQLRRLIADNPEQRAAVRALASLGDRRDGLVTALLEDPSIAFRQEIIGNFSRDPGVLITIRMRSIVDAMAAQEERLLRLRDQQKSERLTQFYWVVGLSLFLLVAILGGIISLILRYNSQLSAAQSSLRVVNEGLEEAVGARTTELSRANEEIQRFAYIVSHDLRSPLVNVLGFTSELDQARKTLHKFLTKLFEEHPELRDESAWLAVEEDLPEALTFIRTSTEKMDRLINSILELSRQGRRTLKPEPLEMTELAESVAATLHQRAETARAVVTVAPLPPLESDRIAVEQIVSNLAENALKYLSPARGGEVRIEGRHIGKQVEISVIDNGRGIAPIDHERIFDLFRRAGAQDQAGEGIGLANVRALAYRLGGRIRVESQLDEGARFTLTLPEKFPVELAG